MGIGNKLKFNFKSEDESNLTRLPPISMANFWSYVIASFLFSFFHEKLLLKIICSVFSLFSCLIKLCISFLIFLLLDQHFDFH